jgi:plasmid stabilization system protein ParE
VVQASQWLAEIETAIQGLADTAPRHPLAREADAFDFPVHQMNFGVSNKPTHRILYSFDDAQVLVYAIRHLSQSDLSPEEIE